MHDDSMSGFTKSKYYTSLQNDTDRRRYEEKLELLGCCEDPYFPLEQKGLARAVLKGLNG